MTKNKRVRTLSGFDDINFEEEVVTETINQEEDKKESKSSDTKTQNQESVLVMKYQEQPTDTQESPVVLSTPKPEVDQESEGAEFKNFRTHIYDDAKKAVKEAEKAVKADFGTPSNANEALERAEAINQARNEAQPHTFHFKHKEQAVKVNYFITRKSKEKVVRYAQAVHAKPSHVIEQLIQRFIPAWHVKDNKGGKK